LTQEILSIAVFYIGKSTTNLMNNRGTARNLGINYSFWDSKVQSRATKARLWTLSSASCPNTTSFIFISIGHTFKSFFYLCVSSLSKLLLPSTSSHKNFGCISDFLCQCYRSHHLIILRIYVRITEQEMSNS
jgi:hypothetical protein